MPIAKAQGFVMRNAIAGEAKVYPLDHRGLFDSQEAKSSEQPPNDRPKRKRAKKIRSELGPFETSCKSFDRGDRVVEIVRITPAAITYRLRGLTNEYTLPHSTAFQKALSIDAGFDTGPRQGAIKRGI